MKERIHHVTISEDRTAEELATEIGRMRYDASGHSWARWRGTSKEKRRQTKNADAGSLRDL